MKFPKTSIIVLLILFVTSVHGDDEEAEDATKPVKAIKCYVCSNADSLDCNDLDKGQTEFLKKCSAGKCFVKEEQHPQILGNYIRTRGCAAETQCVSMDFPLCCECNTDGCNYNNLCSVGDAAAVSNWASKIVACVAVLTFQLV